MDLTYTEYYTKRHMFAAKGRLNAWIITLLTGFIFSSSLYGYIEIPYKDSSLSGKTHIGTVYFAAGSWKLNDPAHKEAIKIARALSLFDQYNRGQRVLVVGFTDRKGESAVNLQLGLARAEELARVLENYGVGMSNARIASFGETRAYDDHKDYRRAEVWLVPDPWAFLYSPVFTFTWIAAIFIALVVVLVVLINRRQNKQFR